MSDTKLRIFIAEDNRADMDLVREAMREHSIQPEFIVATNGTEALAQLQWAAKAGNTPDLFMLDLNLPRTDGHELLALVRANPKFAGIPVIITTSSDAPRDRERAAAMGATDYFRKPTDLMEFLQLGALVLDVTQRREFLQSA